MPQNNINPNLSHRQTALKSGQEPFHFGGQPIGIILHSFWRWNSSDLLSNAIRGTLAEFIVSQALGITLTLPRIEWDVVDLVMDNGTKIEVKSSAYLQSWHQTGFSRISFGIGKKREWDPITNLYAEEAKRHADVYVFALLSEKDKDLVDPLNLDQWQFYVVSTSTLDIQMGNKKQITLNQLEKIAIPVSYQNLKKRLDLI